jgi:acetoin utilization protein AcuC
LLISTHEENRWPRTGALSDQGVGQVWNVPLPAGVADDVAAFVRDEVILPVVQAFRPDAIVLQCGADAVLEDPQSRMAWSNQAHWAIVSVLKSMSPRYLVLGGGGYNPWSVGRCWTGVWATLNDYEVPDILPPAAQDVLRALTWDGQRRINVPPADWLETIADVPRPGVISDDVRARVATLKSRMLRWI